MSPVFAAVKTKTIGIELDCTITVKSNHITKNKITGYDANLSKSTYDDKNTILSFTYHNHKNSNANQTTILNIFFNLSFFENKNNKREKTQITGIAIDAKETLNHKFPSIILTIGVPKFAHKITHIALLKLIINAAIKDTAISTTAVLHCNIMVAIVHVHIDLNNVFVVFCINALNEFVVSFFIASSKRNIHKINNHNHQINSNIFSNIILIKKIKHKKL